MTVEKAARPDDRTPLIESCCDTWRTSPGDHAATCRNVATEGD